jgi:glycine/D-amino acid oxidase-like deaminating enzyme
MSGPLHLDVVIFGGGSAGLWLLDEVRRSGRSVVLLEANELGAGQTIASQGIIHGGLKYTLTGLLTPSAKAIRAMPTVWRRCLAGERTPDLRRTKIRSDFCYLWRARSLTGKLGMIGARAGLHVTPTWLEDHERPEVLRTCEGGVARVGEQVIEPASFLSDLATQHRESLLAIDAVSGLEFQVSSAGRVELVRLINPNTGEPFDIDPGALVLVAGAGNASLLEMLGHSKPAMQRRPLHIVMARGAPGMLPELNGHCVEGKATRLTVTTAEHSTGDRIWQIGGRIAEEGVELDRDQLIERAVSEVSEAVCDVELEDVTWSSYMADRAEMATSGFARPADVTVEVIENVIVGWPTKLALVPRLADRVMEKFEGGGREGDWQQRLADSPAKSWPRPTVALPPWETERTWIIAS